MTNNYVTSMRIGRAHSYEDIEKYRAALAVMPQHWLDAIDWVSWWILPSNLSPLWVGLLKEEHDTHVGTPYSDAGGWFANDIHGWLVRYTPHIYLASDSRSGAALHEVGHALQDAWHLDTEKFYKPEAAFYDYMATNADEYFACAVEAFMYPASDDVNWNREDLAKTNRELFDYLVVKEVHRYAE